MSLHPCDFLIPTWETLRRTRRPRLLLRTARIGQADYDRERDLRRILRLPAPPPPGPETLAMLVELEAVQEGLRTRPPADVGEPWRAARHVEVLIALLAEARLIFAPVPPEPCVPPGPAAMPVVPAIPS